MPTGRGQMAVSRDRGQDRLSATCRDYGDAERPTAWLRRQDSKLCISESEFAKTLSSGREHSNMRISIEGCRVPPHCQRKFQAMIDPAADLIRNAEVRARISIEGAGGRVGARKQRRRYV